MSGLYGRNNVTELELVVGMFIGGDVVFVGVLLTVEAVEVSAELHICTGHPVKQIRPHGSTELMSPDGGALIPRPDIKPE